MDRADVHRAPVGEDDVSVPRRLARLAVDAGARLGAFVDCWNLGRVGGGPTPGSRGPRPYRLRDNSLRAGPAAPGPARGFRHPLIVGAIPVPGEAPGAARLGVRVLSACLRLLGTPAGGGHQADPTEHGAGAQCEEGTVGRPVSGRDCETCTLGAGVACSRGP